MSPEVIDRTERWPTLVTEDIFYGSWLSTALYVLLLALENYLLCRWVQHSCTAQRQIRSDAGERGWWRGYGGTVWI